MHNNLTETEQLEFFISISNMTFLSLEEKNCILANINNATALSQMTTDDISKIVGRNLIRAKFDGMKNLLLAKNASKIVKTLGIKILKNGESDFPAMLSEISDAPFLIFCRGDVSVLRRKSISVVGTREITSAGREVARKFSSDAAKDGYTVISGLAYGVDEEAHKGAIDAYYDALEIDEKLASEIGKTCAVLPGGVDDIVPHGNKKLAQKIVESGGLLISECPPSVPVEKWRFVSRNRIVAALSPVTVVVEAPPASGALITAEMAVSYGRDLVIMETAFSEMAKKVSEQKIKKLEKTSKKHITTLNNFLDEGACVVKDFSDYKRWLSEKPGERQFTLGI